MARLTALQVVRRIHVFLLLLFSCQDTVRKNAHTRSHLLSGLLILPQYLFDLRERIHKDFYTLRIKLRPLALLKDRQCLLQRERRLIDTRRGKCIEYMHIAATMLKCENSSI